MAVGIGMIVAPLPIVVLFVTVPLGELAILFILFRQVSPVSAIFTIIPTMVVAMILVVYPNARSTTGICDWRDKCRREENKSKVNGVFEPCGISSKPSTLTSSIPDNDQSRLLKHRQGQRCARAKIHSARNQTPQNLFGPAG